jgi:hypothetical protein
MSNTLWRIAFGDYDLSVDRRTLAYRLEETKTGTVWADGLSLGWMELEDRATGAVTRHAFGEMTVLSVSEKSAATGKRILFGLDLHGVPVDVYVIAGLREVQMVVEANRDSATHRVHGFGLLPSLCTVPDDGSSHLVVPFSIGGNLIAARNIESFSGHLGIWRLDGTSMPFIGAVLRQGEQSAALALITDSVYGSFRLTPNTDGSARADIEYLRDPERRRLDMRVIPLPYGDHVAVARAYREKIVGENNHVTLRRKIRENPAVESLLGAAWFDYPVMKFEQAAETVKRLRDLCHVDRGIWRFVNYSFPDDTDHSPPFEQAARTIAESGYLLFDGETSHVVDWRDPESVGATVHEITSGKISRYFDDLALVDISRWEAMEEELTQIANAKKSFAIVGTEDAGDWRNIAIDFLRGEIYQPSPISSLHLAVYHDSVVNPVCLLPNAPQRFLLALLHLSPPFYYLYSFDEEFIRRTYAVLSPLHRLTFTAFLTAHRFVMNTFEIQEGSYSDKTRVLVNMADDLFVSAEFALPPHGFYVRHPQMEAHDALRIGDRTFETRAWRIRRSLDGKPLEESQDILTQEFPVPPGE